MDIVRRRLVHASLAGVGSMAMAQWPAAIAQVDTAGGAAGAGEPATGATPARPDYTAELARSPHAWQETVSTYAALRSYRDEMSGAADAMALGVPLRIPCRSRTWFVAPRTFRLEMDNPSQGVVASSVYLHDGTQSWSYQRSRGWRSLDRIELLTAGLFGASASLGGQGYWPFSLMMPELDLSYISLRRLVQVELGKDEEVRREPCQVVTGVLGRDERFRIWISARDRLIRRLERWDPRSGSASFEYRPQANVEIAKRDILRKTPAEPT